MLRHETRLLAPYKSLGEVCSSVPPAFRVLPTQRRITSVLCAIENVVVQYSAEHLRLVSVSDVLPEAINAVAADKRYVYAAAGHRIALLHLSRQVLRWLEVSEKVLLMVPFGEVIVVVDANSSLHVLDIEDGSRVLQIDSAGEFTISAIIHPATYLNKVVVGSTRGKLRLLNVKTGKLIHEFATQFGGKVSALEQSPAVDILGVGLRTGHIHLHNVRTDETIATFTQDTPITAIAFRCDGEDSMISAGDTGMMAIWDLNERRLIGQLPSAHHGSITALYFLAGEPLMVSSGADNTLKTWIFDMGDGMPRQLVILEGHSLPLTDVKFNGRDCVLSASLDGSLRSFSITRDTQRQKLGNAGTMSRAKAKKKKLDVKSIEMSAVCEMAVGGAREAAWDNVACRHLEGPIVTTWSTRKQSLGKHRLLHKRFTEDALLSLAKASALSMSACGNFVLVGYTTGHIDCFNVQSGIHRKTFIGNEKTRTAHSSPVRGITLDPLNKQMISCEETGIIRFWNFSTCKRVAEIRVPSSIVRFRMSSSNSLLAVAVQNGSIGIVDVLCRRTARIMSDAHKASITALEFSPDGRWLLSADEDGLIKVWDLISSSLIDVMKCSKYCIAMSFSPAGEYLATCHDGQKGVFLWANKALFTAGIHIKALPIDYIPSDSAAFPLTRKDPSGDDIVIDEGDEDLVAEEQQREVCVEQVDGLIRLSGLAAPRWANLPNLDIIRGRNKPIEPPKKPKSAPFFLPSTSTLEGFEFEKMETDDGQQREKAIMAKRSLLETESSFAIGLMKASTEEELKSTFESLKWMNISSIDFQIRALPRKAFPFFLRMLLAVMRTGRDFELVQSYLATFLKIHRAILWLSEDGDTELTNLLEELLEEEKHLWMPLDALIADNVAIIQWTKSALI
uniref:WD repeat-containing protein 36 n=1 Tax=Ascaris suum TaxID=6253 RepID=F1KV81_ASCSU